MLTSDLQDIDTQILLLRQVHQLVSTRTSSESSFLTPPPLLEEIEDIKVIYRNYATLYFVFIVDDQESELGILDLIHVFVQSLDMCFESVCELDLVFGWQVLQTVLEYVFVELSGDAQFSSDEEVLTSNREIVQGGLVIETNVKRIVQVSGALFLIFAVTIY